MGEAQRVRFKAGFNQNNVTCGVSCWRTSFFLAFLLVAFSGTLALASLTVSTCRLFLAVLWPAVAENTASPRSNSVSAEVRFGVRGLEGFFFAVLLIADSRSRSPTASSITRTNSSWTEDEQRESSLFLEDLDLAPVTFVLIREEPRPTTATLRCLAGFTGPVMPFFLWEKKSVTRAWAWDMLLLLLLEVNTGTARIYLNPKSAKI